MKIHINGFEIQCRFNSPVELRSEPEGVTVYFDDDVDAEEFIKLIPRGIKKKRINKGFRWVYITFDLNQ